MKACWMLCLVTALSASAAWAESPLQSLQFEQQKQQVLKAVKEKCAPASTLSDTDFANKILASKDNQNYAVATVEGTACRRNGGACRNPYHGDPGSI